MIPDATTSHVRMDGPTGAEGAAQTPVVLVHGVGLDLSMWDLIVDDLSSTQSVASNNGQLCCLRLQKRQSHGFMGA